MTKNQLIGGLLKSSSKLALMAAAGILVGGVSMGSAKAADLGGDCCADLEERVAELEATTARKGNRKVSLSISGQVNRTMMYWNDGSKSRTVAGAENRVDSTRFIFGGGAKVTSNVTVGFEMNIELGLGATTNNISNAGGFNAASTAANVPNVDGGWGGDGAIAFRTANWWVEDKVLGRVTVGRINSGGPVTLVDVGGINSGASARPTLLANGLLFRNATTGGLSTFSATAVTGACYGCNRMDGISWDSISFGGVVLRAAWGENDIFTGSARWAAEFGGFRLAAGAGFEKTAGNANQQRDNSLAVGIASPYHTATGGGVNLTTVPGAQTVQSTGAFANLEWSLGYGIKHNATGIFSQGHYAQSEYAAEQGAIFSDKTASFWMNQVGIAKNWFGPGETAFYGEYGEGKNNGYIFTSSNPGGMIAPQDTKGRMMGAGVNQKIDAAAMEVYFAWHRFELDVNQATVGANSRAQNTVTGVGGAANNTGSLQAIDTIHMGARIRF